MELTRGNEQYIDTDALIAYTDHKVKPRKSNLKLIIITIACLALAVIVLLVVFYTISLSKSPKTQNPIGLFGKWPSYGGNAKNQQITPLKYSTILNEDNIQNISLICQYDTLKEFSFGAGVLYSGYITIDNNNKAYIAEGSGYAQCIDLETCEEIWSVNIAEILGLNKSVTKLGMRQTATLFTTSAGINGIIFGTPNNRHASVNYDKYDPCFAVALNAKNGNLLWKTNLGGGVANFGCHVHGFMVDEDDHFAYGGMSMVASGIPNLYSTYHGRMFKLDINDGQIIHKWHSIDPTKFNYTANDASNPYIYRQASMWNFPAIIGDYLIFGTGDLQTYPKYVEDCLLGNYSALPIENAYCFDPCGNDRSLDSKWWRCLEKGVHTDSFVILNKNSFEIEAAIPLQGVDGYDQCQMEWESCMKVQGPDADLSAVAAFKNVNNGQLYAVAMQKSGQFYMFEVPSGKIAISKKVGPWSFAGGGTWGIAVDPMSMIAVTTITGGNTRELQMYRDSLADGTIICDLTGSAHAIDLNTGWTIWQMVSPLGTFGINNCSDARFADYIDMTVNETCSRDVYGNEMKDAAETAFDNVFIPPLPIIDDNETLRSNAAKLVGPVTISGDMVFIPSNSGHIFIHNLFTGQYIHTLQCPIIGDTISVQGGISVIENRVVFYCGTSTVVSMILDN